MSDIELIVDGIQRQCKVGVDYSGGKDMTAICFTGDQAELIITALQEKLEREKGCKNVSERHPVDEFVCSECGFTLQDYVRAVIDDHDNDISLQEYEIEFCPHCSRRVKG